MEEWRPREQSDMSKVMPWVKIAELGVKPMEFVSKSSISLSIHSVY